MKFAVVNRAPTVEEYNHLRATVEWPTYAHEAVRIALQNSLYTIVVEDNSGVVVGMGRIVGDGAIYLHVQDVIVNPQLQGQGIGKLIMEELMNFVESRAGINTNIGLMCSKGREAFYKMFGFIERPSKKFGAGMIMIKGETITPTSTSSPD